MLLNTSKLPALCWKNRKWYWLNTHIYVGLSLLTETVALMNWLQFGGWGGQVPSTQTSSLVMHLGQPGHVIPFCYRERQIYQHNGLINAWGKFYHCCLFSGFKFFGKTMQSDFPEYISLNIYQCPRINVGCNGNDTPPDSMVLLIHFIKPYLAAKDRKWQGIWS